MGRVPVINAFREVRTDQGITQVPEVRQVRGEVVLLLLGQHGQLVLYLFQGRDLNDQ